MKRWLLSGAIVAVLISPALANEKARFDPEVEATLAPMPVDSQALVRCAFLQSCWPRNIDRGGGRASAARRGAI